MNPKRTAVLIVALVVLVAACSGDDGSATTTGLPETTTTTGPATTTTSAGGDTTATTAADGAVDDSLAVYYTPVTVDQGTVKVTFDRWFWALLDGTGTVTVTRDGQTVVEGPISGPDAVMGQEADGTLVFKDASGAEVARVGPQELFDTISKAMADAGIG